MKTIYKNILIIGITILILGGLWSLNARKAGYEKIEAPQTATSTTETATTTPATEKKPAQTATSTASQVKKPAEPARIMVLKNEFHYDLDLQKTQCGDRIGSFEVTSSEPSKELYWGMTGSKPIWLTFSSVEGKTPATVDMTFNCITSGIENDINWTFTVVEKTKEGKWVDGYYRPVKLTGTIKQ